MQTHSRKLGALAERIAERAGFDGLGENLRRALVGHARGVAGGERAAPALPEVLTLLNASHRATFQDELAEIIGTTGPGVEAPFFEVFGSELTGASKLDDDSWLATKIVEPMVGGGDGVSLEWLAEYFEGRSTEVESGHYAAVMKEAVSRRRSDPEMSDETTGAIARIAKVLGVKELDDGDSESKPVA